MAQFIIIFCCSFSSRNISKKRKLAEARWNISKSTFFIFPASTRPTVSAGGLENCVVTTTVFAVLLRHTLGESVDRRDKRDEGKTGRIFGGRKSRSRSSFGV